MSSWFEPTELISLLIVMVGGWYLASRADEIVAWARLTFGV